MSAEYNLQVLKDIYSDHSTLARHAHPDLLVHNHSNSPLAGEFRGVDGLMAHLAHMAELSNNTMRLVGTNFMTDGDRGVGLSRITAQRNGASIDARGIGLWRFEDGKLIEHWEFIENASEWDAFWS